MFTEQLKLKTGPERAENLIEGVHRLNPSAGGFAPSLPPPSPWAVAPRQLHGSRRIAQSLLQEVPRGMAAVGQQQVAPGPRVRLAEVGHQTATEIHHWLVR